MPRAFNEQEEAQIRDLLKKRGRQLFAAQGVRKTSIEQITKAAGIAKGSFYKFYRSKELLFFELLEEVQDDVRNPLTTRKEPAQTRTRGEFEALMSALFERLCNEPLIQYMGQESEIMAISRNVPPEILQEHKKNDRVFLQQMIDTWNTKIRRPDTDVVAARLSLVLLVSMKHEVFGKVQLVHAATAAISSLADCFFDRKNQMEHELHHAGDNP